MGNVQKQKVDEGTGLERVFSALSGKRRVTRAAAEGKGVARAATPKMSEKSSSPSSSANLVMLERALGAEGWESLRKKALWTKKIEIGKG